MALPLLLAGAAIQGVGALLQHQKGSAQASEASRLKQQRDQALGAIPLEDPRQVQILEEVRRRRRSFETGTAFESQLRNLRSAQTGTQQNILRAAGGAGGAALGALSRTQLAVGRGIADIGKVSTQAQLSLTNMIGAQSNLITKRKDQLQLLRFSQLSAEAAQKEKEANANKNAATATAVGLGGTLLGGAIDGVTIPKKADESAKDVGSTFTGIDARGVLETGNSVLDNDIVADNSGLGSIGGLDLSGLDSEPNTLIELLSLGKQ